jgi:DNA-directed RNA polymerase specialized sigma24 family protein
VADEAWKKALADPGCFARGELRKWATRAARRRYKDLLAERTGPFARSGFCGRNWMAMARTCAASDVGSFR